MPPVAKTAIPAARAAIMVAATVVAPDPPVARQAAMSARDSLETPLDCAKAAVHPGGEADTQFAFDDGDGGGGGALGADLGLDGGRGLDVLRPGHAVGVDGGFQRDEWFAGDAAACASGEKRRVSMVSFPRCRWRRRRGRG